MKSLDKKNKLAYQDVFLYTKVTSRLIQSSFSANISSPFYYKNGDVMEIYVDNDVITGVANRNFQRDRLNNSRGKVILINGVGHKERVVGRWSKIKENVTLYPTERLLPEEIKLLGVLQKHLTNNNITVIIDIDEKKRFRLETRRRRGDNVQYREIEH